MLAAEAVGVAAGRGQAGHFTSEGIFDQFLGVAQFILECRPVVAPCNQVRVGEAMALDVEQGIVENGAQFGAAKLQHFGDEEEGCGHVALEVNVGDGAHAIQEFGDVFGRVAEASLTSVLIPPGEYTFGVIGGQIIGHRVPLFRIGREWRESLPTQLLLCALDSTCIGSSLLDAIHRHG